MVANSQMYNDNGGDPFSDSNEIDRSYDWDQHLLNNERLLSWSFRSLLVLAFQVSVAAIIACAALLR